MQVPPEQVADPVADTLTLRRLSSWASHAMRLTPFRLTYCPLQKSAPVTWEHWVVQPPVTVEEQLAYPISWQLMSQLKFACA